MVLRRRCDSAALVVGLISTVVAFLALVAADARWLAALGRLIVDRHGVPDGIPYAVAPTEGWHNVPVLSELIFHFLQAGLNDRGMQLAQVVAVTGGFGFLAWDAVREGAQRALGPVLFLVAVGCFPVLIAVRVQLFSLALFPILLTLLRAESRQPSSRIWLLVPLLALWSNLHGAVLVGLATSAAYLLVDRARREPILALAVLVSSVLALALTPALYGTFAYYHSVLQNEAARRGAGQWSPLSLHHILDLLLIVVAIPILALALRARPRLWELAALAGLGALTIHTARGGVWLLFAAVAPAARGPVARWMPARVPTIALAPLALLAVAGIFKGPIHVQASPPLVSMAVRESHGGPVLADDLSAEQVALAGGRVLVSNPLDAFRRSDQALYLDWLEGKPDGDAALKRVRVVLVSRGNRAQRRLATKHEFRELKRDNHAVLYVRV